MKKNFEEFLQEEFAKNYTGIKDQYEVAEEQWFEQLDVSELIDYGDKYADSKQVKIDYHDVLGSMSEIIDDMITEGSVMFSMKNKIDIPTARRVIINEILYKLEQTKK